MNAGGIEVLQHSHDVLALAFRPDGKQIATATLDGQIHFWDPQEGELQARAPRPHHTQPACLPASLAPHLLPCEGDSPAETLLNREPLRGAEILRAGG